MRKPRSGVGQFGAIALAMLLGGCVSSGTLVDPRVPPAGSSSDFTDGYIQGCNSGFMDADWDNWETLWHRDQTLYATNPEYRKGWDKGHAACYVYGIEHYRPSSRGGGPSVGGM